MWIRAVSYTTIVANGRCQFCGPRVDSKPLRFVYLSPHLDDVLACEEHANAITKELEDFRKEEEATRQ